MIFTFDFLSTLTNIICSETMFLKISEINLKFVYLKPVKKKELTRENSGCTC